MQRDTENDSSSPGDSSDVTLNAGSWLSSLRRETSPSFTVNQLRNENPGQSLGEIGKRLASIEKEKELISLTQKLNEIEPDKTAGFPVNRSSILSESPDKLLIRRQIIQDSKLSVPVIRAYPDLNHNLYQNFICACEYVFRT